MSEEEMSFTEACAELAVVIQAKEHEHIDTYALIIAEFIESIENGETPRMALALAKDKPASIDRWVNEAIDSVPNSP